MRGRPAFAPTDDQRRQVKAMAAYGVPQGDIATVLNIDAKTLRKHFWLELQTGSIEANAKVAQSLFQRATTEKGSAGVTAAIFWLKTRGGDPWREIKRTELTGKDGKPLMIDDGRRDVIDSSDLTPEQRQALRQIITQAVAQKINEVPDLIEGDYEDVTDDDEYEYEEDEE